MMNDSSFLEQGRLRTLRSLGGIIPDRGGLWLRVLFQQYDLYLSIDALVYLWALTVSFSRSIVFSERASKLNAKYLFKLLMCSLTKCFCSGAHAVMVQVRLSGTC